MKKKFYAMCSVLLTLCMFLALMVGCGSGNNTAGAPDGNAPAADGHAGAPADTLELKLATHDPSTSGNTQMVQTLADEVYDATEGRVRITVHADAVLGPAVDGLTMLDTGVCDMIWTTTSFFADQFPMCELFTMPFIGADNVFDLTNAFWDLYEAHPEYFEKEFAGYHPVGMYVGGQGVFATSKPLNGIEDMKGLTMRVVTGPLSTMAQSIGVNAVTMGPNDIFLSMEKGVLDGYMFNCDGLRNFALFDVTEYAYCFGNSTMDANILVLMSENAWNKISPEDQAVISEIWGRAGSLKEANVLYESAQKCRETLGDKFIQLTEGEFYDAVKAEAESAVDAYLARPEFEGIPMEEAYSFIQERIEAYRD